MSITSQYCRDVHRVLAIECVCAFEPGEAGVHVRLVYSIYSTVSYIYCRELLGKMIKEYNDRALKVNIYSILVVLS